MIDKRSSKPCSVSYNDLLKFDCKSCNSAYMHQAQIRSWNQQVLCYESKVSWAWKSCCRYTDAWI